MTYLQSLLARKVMLHTRKQLKKVIVWQMQRQTYLLKIYCVVSTFLWLSSWQSTVLLILIYMASNEWKNPVHERGNQAFQPNWADPCTVSTVIITRQGFIWTGSLKNFKTIVVVSEALHIRGNVNNLPGFPKQNFLSISGSYLYSNVVAKSRAALVK